MSAWILWRTAEYLNRNKIPGRKTLIFVHRTMPMLLIRIIQNNYLFFRESSNKGRWVSDHAHRLRLRYSMPSLMWSSPKTSSRPQHWEAELEEEDWLGYLTVPPIDVHSTWQAASKAAHFCKGHLWREKDSPQKLAEGKSGICLQTKVRNCLKLSKNKSPVLHLGRNTQYRLGFAGKQPVESVGVYGAEREQRPAVSWAGEQDSGQQREGTTALYSTHQTTSRIHKLQPQIQEIQQRTEANFCRGFQNWLGSGAPDL